MGDENYGKKSAEISIEKFDDGSGKKKKIKSQSLTRLHVRSAQGLNTSGSIAPMRRVSPVAECGLCNGYRSESVRVSRQCPNKGTYLVVIVCDNGVSASVKCELRGGGGGGGGGSIDFDRPRDNNCSPPLHPQSRRVLLYTGRFTATSATTRTYTSLFYRTHDPAVCANEPSAENGLPTHYRRDPFLRSPFAEIRRV